MPIYEFYCSPCHTLFSFFARSANTQAKPDCPRCGQSLQRRMSTFSVGNKKEEESAEDAFPVDEARMEKALAAMAREAEGMDENDPRQAAALMRKMSDMAGMKLGQGMEEALSRMEAGEDPETVEAQLAGQLDENPFVLPEKKARPRAPKDLPPNVDDKLYEL